MKAFGSLSLIIIGAIAVVLYSALFVVDIREQVLVTRFGEVQRTIDKPGLYFKTPFIEELVRVDKRMLFFESNDMSVQVVDGRRYLVDSITMIKIVNPQKFLESAGASLSQVHERIKTRLDAALRQTYGRRTFDAALSKDRPAMMREIRDQVRGEAVSLGTDIIDVRIRRTDLMPDVLKDTYERMNAERFAEAAELRATGQAKATKIRAEADRGSVEQIAQAKKESEITRGQGDAERNKVFAEAFQRDPKFFSFYRSMQAYQYSLGGDGTTMVLSPDSEFFQFFDNRSNSDAQ